MKLIQRKCPGIIFATRSGGTTIDRDACGGNPFATALIEAAKMESVSLQNFPERLRSLTVAHSNGHQEPECRSWPTQENWSFQLSHGSRQESRIALLLVVSDYSGIGIAPLVGAAFDERRLSAMFAANGFSVVQGVAPCRAAILESLASFGRQSQKHDVAVVYCTGHGLEWNGQNFLLPGDCRLDRGFSRDQLRNQTVSVDRINTVCSASKLNFVFFAGCRTLASPASNSAKPNRAKY